MSERDVIDLVLDDLETTLNSANDCRSENLLASWTEDALAQVDVVVV